MSVFETLIRVPHPFSFAHTVAAARFYSVLGTPTETGAYRRVLRLQNTLALAEFAPVESGVVARLLAANGPVDSDAFAARARWLVFPELDLGPLYAQAETDADLERLIRALYGLRAFRLDSAFEALAVTIIEQQIALSMAQTAERWLIGAYGESLEYEGEPYFAFPRPEVLAQLAVADLTPLKITFLRMDRLLAIARAISAGTLDLESLVGDPDALYARVLALHGVGHWTACWTLIRASGQFRYFGRADVALRAAANWHFAGLPGRMDGDPMDAIFARFGGQAGLAAFYLDMHYGMERMKR